jgi:RAVE protein 1 C terminal
MVKIWRRLSLADQRFEFDYLPHPSVVTGLCWRRPFHRDQSFDNVLYTFCEDNKLRIWSPGDSLSHHILQLWAEIDLMESIQPRSLNPEDKSNRRFAFMIHSRDFTIATERAVQSSSKTETESIGLHHLIEVANRSPEICVVLDEKGNMSAWGIENIGARNRMPGDIFNVAHVEGLKLRFNVTSPAADQNVQFLPYCSEKGENPFTILVHHFDGRLELYESKLDVLFDPTRQSNRLIFKVAWTGHSGEIKKVIRSVTGKAIFSRTKLNESIVWTQKSSALGPIITRSSVVPIEEHIHRAWILQDGHFVVFLHHHSISLWDTWKSRAVQVARTLYKVDGKPLCLLYIPEVRETGLVHLAMISNKMKGVSWEVRLPPPDSPTAKATLEEFDHFDLSSEGEVDFVLSVDPAGTLPVFSGFLDTSARDIAISYTTCGKLTSWTARTNLEQRKLEWLVTSTVETYIDRPSLASGTSIRKAALVNSDCTQLTIWSTKGEALEHEERYPQSHGAIQDLDWSSTPDNQSILAVGFPHRIIVYGQLRFDYIDSKPAWAPLREINALDFTSHPIGDSVWLSGGNFAVGAGNQIIILDDKLPLSESFHPDLRLSGPQKAEVDIFTVVSRLNGPLPVYHPQYLAQFILGGKILLVQRILLRLWKVLKFYTEGDSFDSMLGFSIDDFSNEIDSSSRIGRRDMNSSYIEYSEDEPETITEDVAASLHELLTTRLVPLLSSREQFLLADTVECVATVEKHRRSTDENGCRYFLFFRQHILRQSQHIQESSTISWREIIWAFHSKSQDILGDLLTHHYSGRLLWQSARECGMFMWMTDLTALVPKSKSHYTDLILILYSELSLKSLQETNTRKPTTRIRSTAPCTTLL